MQSKEPPKSVKITKTLIMTNKTGRNGYYAGKTGATAPAEWHSPYPKHIHFILQTQHQENDTPTTKESSRTSWNLLQDTRK